MAYYGNSCTTLPEHYCDPCGAIEQGRVRGIALIDENYYPTLLADPSNHLLWLAGINQNLITIVPFVNGEVADPSRIDVPGVGSQIKRFVGYNNVANIVDPNYASNVVFWNRAKQANNRVFAYTTENYVHFSGNTVYISPSNPVQNDITSLVEIKVTVEWASKDMPVPYTIPTGIFECPPA